MRLGREAWASRQGRQSLRPGGRGQGQGPEQATEPRSAFATLFMGPESGSQRLPTLTPILQVELKSQEAQSLRSSKTITWVTCSSTWPPISSWPLGRRHCPAAAAGSSGRSGGRDGPLIVAGDPAEGVDEGGALRGMTWQTRCLLTLFPGPLGAPGSCHLPSR